MIDTITSARSPAVGRSSSRVPRLGFAGVGWIGRHRMNAIASAGTGEVAAVSDPALPEDDPLWAAHPGALRAAGFEELLDHDPDGIVIATPSALHASQSIAALERGIAVFCQKPLGRDGAETRAVVDAARAADRLLGVDLSYRHTTGMRAIRDELRSGGIGDVVAVETVFHNAYGPDKPWFYHRSEAGGGCLLDLGIHLIDLALWCMDFPTVVRASGSIHLPDENAEAVETNASGLLVLDNGASLQLGTSWRSPLPCDAEIGIRFIGTRGSLWFRNVNGSFYDFEALRIRTDRSTEVLCAAPDDWGGRGAAAWARQLAVSRAFDPEAAHLVDAAAALDAIYRSARSI
jgi:predicted dehydrogenase